MAMICVHVDLLYHCQQNWSCKKCTLNLWPMLISHPTVCQTNTHLDGNLNVMISDPADVGG